MMQEWVLLWSARQNALHVENVARMLESNRIAYRDGMACDYVPLVIGSRDLVESTAANLQGTLVRRDAVRAATAGAPT